MTQERGVVDTTAYRFEVPAGRIHRISSVVLGILALIWVWTRIDFGATLEHLRRSNYWWFALGFAAFYVSLPLRAWRWALMLRNLGMVVPAPALIGTIFRAWTVNCIIPGRAGDVYSAFVLRAERGLSAAATAGSILGARVLDILILIALLTVAFSMRLHADVEGVPQALIHLAWGMAAVVLVGLVVLARSGRWVESRLPARFAPAWASFTDATFRSVQRVPLLVLITWSLWMLEALRLWCVLGAVGAPRPGLQITLLALVAALVTTLPITPGGLGTVEALYQGVLPNLGITADAAVSVAVLDRTINYWFILGAGSIYFLIQRRVQSRRGQ